MGRSDVALPAEVLAWLSDPANWTGPDGVIARTVEHVGLSAAAVGLACLLAVPWGLWLGYSGRGGTVAINVTNVGRAVPTFAVLVLLALGPLGLSSWSTLVALVLFAIPPILTNTYVGVSEVDPDARAAAVGMGMSGRQVLARVEVPLAAPLLLVGVQVATIQVIATATIAALVAGPGLGRIITAGFGLQDEAQVVAGALLVAGLALLTDLAFAALARRIRRRAGAAVQ
jgi:osmoprotectant transport system permease protein